MQERKLAPRFEQHKQRTKNELSNSRCRQHPDFDLDTICFHQQCRERRNQIICYCCGSEEQPHISHTQDLYPIFKTSPGFRLVNVQNDPNLLAWMTQQKQKVSQTIEKLQIMVCSALGELTARAQQRLECFGDFFQKNGIYKICSRLRHFGDSHTKCCLPLLNSLKDLQGSEPVSNSQTRQVIQNQIAIQSQLIKSQTDFIWKQFQVIVEKALQFNQETSDEYSSQQVVTSEIIPLEQRFPQIAAAIMPQNNGQSKQEMIDVEEVEVKNSESMLLNNQIMSRNEKIQDFQPSKPMKSFKKCQKKMMKPHKEVRQSNQVNKSNPIDLDEVSRQLNNSKSLIDGLLISEVKDLSNQCSQIKPRTRTSEAQEKNLKRTIQQEKCPIGTYFEDRENLIIWNAEKFDEIIIFLSSARQVLHLIILDKQITKECALLKIISGMPWLAGLHLHCDSLLTNNVLNEIRTPYFSYFISCRFIQAADRIKYFPRGSPTMLENLPSCLLPKPSKFRNVFIQSHDCSSIDAETEEISFVQDNSDVFWVFGMGLEKCLLKPNKLMVLVFRRILIRKSVDLKQVYERHNFLHTIVFEDCQCQHNQLVNQLRYLRQNQLVHFQLSGESLDHKIQLGQEQADVIFNQISLETLILEHVEFKSVKRQGLEKDSSRILKKIQNLGHLAHLNLYNTEPVYSEIISYLNPRCIRRLRTLNLGCTEINSKAVMFLERLTQLENLTLDYTEISEQDLLIVLSKMKRLKQLSVENLNGTRIIYEENNHNKNKKSYGMLTSHFFNRLKYKTLQYINIFNCFSLKGREWSDYPQLECIRVNKDLLKPEILTQLVKKGVKVYVDDADNHDEKSIAPPKEKQAKIVHKPPQSNGKKPKKSQQQHCDSFDEKRSTVCFANNNSSSTNRPQNDSKIKHTLRRSHINTQKSPLPSSSSRDKN